jgi:hypothetical protein
MGRNRIFRTLVAIVLSALALSLTQCIIVPLRHSTASAPAPATSNAPQVVAKQEEPKVAPAPRPAYSVGQEINTYGTVMADGRGGFSLSEDRTGVQFSFVNLRKEEVPLFQKYNRQHVQVVMRILKVESFRSYDVDFIAFGR